MSNKTQLSTNNTKLASLIQELANKAAGGGGSGGVETCSVRLYNTDEYIALMAYAYTTVNEAGEITPTFVNITNWYDYKPFDITLENVVCGSAIDVSANAKMDFGYEAENADIYGSYGDMDLWGFVVKAPSGGMATIELTGAD